MSARDKDVVWKHGENFYSGWRCNYCHTQKGEGGATKLKQHLAGRGVEVVHCRNVPPNVREYFQRDIERTKKATVDSKTSHVRVIPYDIVVFSIQIYCLHTRLHM